MTYPIWRRLIAFVTFCCCVIGTTHANPTSSEAEVRQLWQLLDYVAVDYAGAVQNGAIVSELEYGEMQEFSTRAQNQVQALPPHPLHAELAAATIKLKQAVERKESPQQVAQLAREANRVLLQAYPFPVAPRALPDLARGAALYQVQCASCHGAAGAGDGALAAKLEPKPIAFTDEERARSRSLMALYQVISQGVEGTSMPAFAGLSEHERWSLAFYVGSLALKDTDIAAGESAFAQNNATSATIPDMNTLVTATEEELAKASEPSTARAVLAYARTHPGAVQEQQERKGIVLARKLLQDSLDALKNNQRAKATELALSAYLDGFEPLEARLDATDRQLLVDVERTMQLYRGAVAQGNVLRATEYAGQLDADFVRVEELTGANKTDATTVFVGALTILLREGVEALLIVIAMVAFLRKAERPQALHYVHAGWISALGAGALTWVVATYMVSISGASREVTEGLSSLFAAAVLLSVGLWMHQKGQAGQWQAYLKQHLTAAMEKRSAWALFALAFIAVYREVFETVLFYSALAADGNGPALLAGFVTGLVLLSVIAVIFLRTSARMPIGKFFSFSSVLVAVLAVVLVGKGIAGLQEAGWMMATPITGLRVPVLGIYPTIQTYGAQLALLLAAGLGFGFNLVKARR
ncbi:cytochrome c/FTR1 family iron permease [Massilia yuzhufengensis]|uniref:High-affinity iron transporter n=1 Tax=Massilia yuzhufengensis TaxID=1164594 RepID=A0A1I1VZG1_9BURK|nr:cytochrome c/FTR1 family iron permease [Massilia yuzhufengensis]SFD86463.1 high-affinity iron transporter [Massilia yuzhufengensis]